ncbi:MAG: OmpH family outer membrane protein [Limisphaerales bacterium]|jgi:Skp family chaperone for outer membrane proteins
MKRVLMMLFLAVGLNLGYTLNAATAIGVISLEKVYNGYWRTDVENKKLKSKQEEALDRIKKLEESLRKEGTVLGNMIKAMQDPRLAAAERSNRQQQVQTKQKELQQMQDAIQGFRERTRKDLELDMRKEREQIMEEIQQIVSTEAKKRKLNLVLDEAARSAAIAPIVIFTDGENDLTEEVLRQLNLSDPKKGSGGNKDK